MANVGLAGFVSAAATKIEPGFDLLATAGPNPLRLGLGTAWVGDPDNIGMGLPGWGARQFDFGDGNSWVDTGNTALFVERKDPMSIVDFGPNETSRLDIVALSLRSVGDVTYYNNENLGPGSLRILQQLDRSTPNAPNDKTIIGKSPRVEATFSSDGKVLQDLGKSITACDPSGNDTWSCLEAGPFTATYHLSGQAVFFPDNNPNAQYTVLFNHLGPSFYWESETPTGFVLIKGINDQFFNVGEGPGGFNPAVIPLPPTALLLLSALCLPMVRRRRTP